MTPREMDMMDPYEGYPGGYGRYQITLKCWDLISESEFELEAQTYMMNVIS